MLSGDNMNDRTMIENAGLGIAMGESNPRIKEIADYVTDDNNNEGVKKALEKFCLFLHFLVKCFNNFLLFFSLQIFSCCYLF